FDVLGLAPEHQSGGTKYQQALDAAMSVVLDVRRKARESKDWATSDALRDALAQGGIVVKDGPDGSSYRVE
ncbi:MAG: CysS/YqeB C-terminal domain-containing protein, partial [Schleiferiaceae bacterium]